MYDAITDFLQERYWHYVAVMCALAVPSMYLLLNPPFTVLFYSIHPGSPYPDSDSRLDWALWAWMISLLPCFTYLSINTIFLRLDGIGKKQRLARAYLLLFVTFAASVGPCNALHSFQRAECGSILSLSWGHEDDCASLERIVRHWEYRRNSET